MLYEVNPLDISYDCIAGISGGVDSTYAICIAKKWGLRPLAVQLANGDGNVC